MIRTKSMLTEEEIRSSLTSVLRDGITTQIMLILTGGIFLISYTLDLGGNNVIIGLIVAIPSITQLIQIPGIMFVERFRNRRKITVFAAGLSRLFLLPIAFIPFIPFDIRIPVLLIIISLHYGVGAIGNCSWDSWMKDLIPTEHLGRFFSRRMTYAVAFGIIVSFFTGLMIDYWQAYIPDQKLIIYSFLYIIGFIVGIIGVLIVSTIYEPSMTISTGKPRIRKLLRAPLNDTNFRLLLLFLIPWNFAINLAAPFFVVYMINILQIDLFLIVIFQIFAQITNIIFFRIWGNIIDKYSNKSVLLIVCPLFLTGIIIWVFTTASNFLLTLIILVLIHLILGISSAGINLATLNIGLKLAPKGSATSYLAVRNILIAIAAGFAPLVAGILADLLVGVKFPFINYLDVIFIIATFLGVIPLIILARVQEFGEVKESTVLLEVITQMKNYFRLLPVSAGVRQMTHLPSTILRNNNSSKSKNKHRT